MRTLLVFLMVAISGASFAQGYHIRDVKVLKVEPFYNGDYKVRITLDLSAYQYDAFVSGCIPTRDAWVVTAWGFSQEFESQIMSTASLAMATDSTVDVRLHDTTCDTSANAENLPVLGSPSETMDESAIPSGMGRRVFGLVINEP